MVFWPLYVFTSLLFALSLTPHIYHRGQMLELASHFQVQYFIGSLCLVTLNVFALGWNTLFVGLALSSLCLNGIGLLPWINRHKRDEADEGLKILQFNVFNYNDRHDDALAYVLKEDPDVFVAAEVTPEWYDSLRRLREHMPHVLAEPRSGSHGMAIFSKYPIQDAETRCLSDLTPQSMFLSLDWQGQKIRLASLHPHPPMKPHYRRDRDLHFDYITHWVRDLTDQPVIVLGDLNCTMFSPVYKRALQKTGLENSRRGRGLHPTWPSSLPWFLRLPIDHVLHNDKIIVLDFKAGPNIGSDHLPTITRLKLAA